jgi:hypothetical protein
VTGPREQCARRPAPTGRGRRGRGPAARRPSQEPAHLNLILYSDHLPRYKGSNVLLRSSGPLLDVRGLRSAPCLCSDLEKTVLRRSLC